jgi:uncharacterized Fe-S cluster protein YjdI
MGRKKSYEGDGVVIHFEARRCIHAAECVSNLPAVFSVDRRPWISPGGAAAEEIARVVQRCPSGALTYERTDGGPAEGIAGPTEITTAPDGPLYVRGAVEIADQNGRTVCLEPRVALCRCGASKNKPFCDNSHVAVGFSDSR